MDINNFISLCNCHPKQSIWLTFLFANTPYPLTIYKTVSPCFWMPYKWKDTIHSSCLAFLTQFWDSTMLLHASVLHFVFIAHLYFYMSILNMLFYLSGCLFQSILNRLNYNFFKHFCFACMFSFLLDKWIGKLLSHRTFALSSAK